LDVGFFTEDFFGLVWKRGVRGVDVYWHFGTLVT
jgi:hypothetical protein